MPAQAGIHSLASLHRQEYWIPACAGMTGIRIDSPSPDSAALGVEALSYSSPYWDCCSTFLLPNAYCLTLRFIDSITYLVF